MYEAGQQKPRPPCERCGAEHDAQFTQLSDHHVYPDRYNYENLVRDKVIALCETCHDDVEKLIVHHERMHGKTNCRSELPKWMYPHLSLMFITN